MIGPENELAQDIIDEVSEDTIDEVSEDSIKEISEDTVKVLERLALEGQKYINFNNKFEQIRNKVTTAMPFVACLAIGLGFHYNTDLQITEIANTKLQECLRNLSFFNKLFYENNCSTDATAFVAPLCEAKPGQCEYEDFMTSLSSISMHGSMFVSPYIGRKLLELIKPHVVSYMTSFKMADQIFTFVNHEDFLKDIMTPLPRNINSRVEYLERYNKDNSIAMLIKLGAKHSDFSEKYWAPYLSNCFNAGVVFGQYGDSTLYDRHSSLFDENDAFDNIAQRAFLKGWETQLKIVSERPPESNSMDVIEKDNRVQASKVKLQDTNMTVEQNNRPRKKLRSGSLGFTDWF